MRRLKLMRLAVGVALLYCTVSALGAKVRQTNVFCYFEKDPWRRDSNSSAEFTPADINATLCTHIVYHVARLNTMLQIRTVDIDQSDPNAYYKDVLELKSKGVKVLLAVGGWNDSLPKGAMAEMARDSNTRVDFIESLIAILKIHRFDGINLMWMYPGCPQANCNMGDRSEESHFTSLIQEMRQNFDKENKGWILSAVITSLNSQVGDYAYNVKALNKNLDFMGVWTFHFYGPWEPNKLLHHAPLYPYSGVDRELTVNHSIRDWIGKGISKGKLLMGISFDGPEPLNLTYKLANISAHSYVPATHFSADGPVTTFTEICDNVKNKNWTSGRLESGGRSSGRYAMKDGYWVSYDDVQAIQEKIQYVIDKELGGAFVIFMGHDDPKGTCGCGEQPLLTAIYEKLQSNKSTKDCT